MKVFARLHEIYGNHEAISIAFHVSRQAVTHWKRDGIPAKRAKQCERLTRGKITMMDVMREVR